MAKLTLRVDDSNEKRISGEDFSKHDHFKLLPGREKPTRDVTLWLPRVEKRFFVIDNDLDYNVEVMCRGQMHPAVGLPAHGTIFLTHDGRAVRGSADLGGGGGGDGGGGTTVVQTSGTVSPSTQAQIDANTAGISTNSSRIDGLTTSVQANTNVIATNLASINSNDADITGLGTRLTTAEAAITSNDTDITGLATRLTAAESAIAEGGGDGDGSGSFDDTALRALISANTTAITNNDTDITTLSGRITANTTAIDSNDGEITALANLVAANTGNISTNATGLTTLGTRLSTAESAITSNDTDITSLGTRLTSAESAITSNDGDITALAGRVTSNTTAITAENGRVTALTTRVAANEAAIAADDGGGGSFDDSALRALITTNTNDILTATAVAESTQDRLTSMFTAEFTSTTTTITVTERDFESNFAYLITKDNSTIADSAELTLQLPPSETGPIYLRNLLEKPVNVTVSGGSNTYLALVGPMIAVLYFYLEDRLAPLTDGRDFLTFKGVLDLKDQVEALKAEVEANTTGRTENTAELTKLEGSQGHVRTTVDRSLAHVAASREASQAVDGTQALAQFFTESNTGTVDFSFEDSDLNISVAETPTTLTTGGSPILRLGTQSLVAVVDPFSEPPGSDTDFVLQTAPERSLFGAGSDGQYYTEVARDAFTEEVKLGISTSPGDYSIHEFGNGLTEEGVSITYDENVPPVGTQINFVTNVYIDGVAYPFNFSPTLSSTTTPFILRIEGHIYGRVFITTGSGEIQVTWVHQGGEGISLAKALWRIEATWTRTVPANSRHRVPLGPITERAAVAVAAGKIYYEIDNQGQGESDLTGVGIWLSRQAGWLQTISGTGAQDEETLKTLIGRAIYDPSDRWLGVRHRESANSISTLTTDAVIRSEDRQLLFGPVGTSDSVTSITLGDDFDPDRIFIARMGRTTLRVGSLNSLPSDLDWNADTGVLSKDGGANFTMFLTLF